MRKVSPGLNPANVEVEKNTITRSTIKAIVAFRSQEDAEEAVKDLDGKVFEGSSKASVSHNMFQAAVGEIEPTSQLPQQ